MNETWTKDDILNDRRYCQLLNEQYARLKFGMKAKPKTGRQARTGCEDIIISEKYYVPGRTFVLRGGRKFAGDDFYARRKAYLKDLVESSPLFFPAPFNL